ncbi:RNase J family beta-CASP ribonuclease [Candidatus Peregrinibacteria bacterium]|nr:RNase J family beta-CASP ribonuclease [Candidatus Peregrinibacteria bacterium]
MDDRRNESNGKKLDILDQWLKQTLNIGRTNAPEKTAQAGPSSSPSGQNQAAQMQPGQKPAQPVPGQVSSAGQNNQAKPTGPNPGQPGKKGGKNRKPFKKGGFGGGNFNQRHKFQSALRRASEANPNQQKYDPKGVLRIIPIGGLDEVGKNTMIFEYEDSIFLVDLGFQFPEADMLGVDYVIPDINYLKDKIHKIKGIVVTHGHLDHIGGIPYLLNKLGNPPIFAGKLTMGLITKQLEEHGLMQTADLRTVNFNTDQFYFGKMKVSFFRVTHSIPDSCGLYIETPAGSIVHTGDFKIDLSPAGAQLPPDFAKIAGFGEKSITALMSDSTNAMKPGYTISEKKIGQTLDSIIKDAKGRVIIASFSSQIGRIQQIIEAAMKHGKKIFLSGRSLIDNSVMAAELGYLKYPQGLISDVRKSKKHPADKTIILTTGSQGEPVAALSRMALNEHSHVQISKGDTVVLSSSPIPGNEMAVVRVTNNLTRLGARVINNHIMDVHTSGHGQQEDLKLMFSLVKPKYFIPIHGEYFMRKIHGEIMVNDLGFPEEKVIMVENGDVMEMRNGELKYTGEKVQTNYILVDGAGGGDIGSQVMMDRQILAENGVIVVMLDIDVKTRAMKGPVKVESRGFIYMEESQEIINGICRVATDAYNAFAKNYPGSSFEEVKLHIRESVDKFVVGKIERQPLIIPVILG